MRNLNSFAKFATIFGSAAVSLVLAGCGLGSSGSLSKSPTPVGGAFAITGHVHGGQQAVSGSTVNIYAVGTTGYGSPSVSLLNSGVTVQSAGDGTFSLTGKYTCTAEQRVYVTATGGDAGSGPNGALTLMAALGRCGDLTSSTFISMNEVTTVASVWALAPFMSGIANIGAPASNVTGINNAFSDVNSLASISTGNAGGSVPAGTTIPVATINTLADILAACINSNGSGQGCSTLFGGAAVGGSMPNDTLSAAINIAQHPAVGVATLYPLALAQSPFQPTLPDQPSDFTLAVTFSGGFTSPTSVAADANGNVWVVDSTANKLTELAHSGVPLMTANGLNGPSAVAIDQSGNAWVANAGNSTVAMVTPGGAVSTFSGGGLNVPESIAVDGQSNIWLANFGNNSVSEFNSSGVPLSGSGFASAGGTPIAVVFNPN
jgi:streptogramin lyase